MTRNETIIPSSSANMSQPSNVVDKETTLDGLENVPATSSVTASEQPYEPGPEEAALYYFGAFPSGPRMVARSSTHQWHKKIPDRPEYPTKVKDITFASRHPIHHLWNNSDGPLRKDIMKALDGLEWNAIDIFGIGYYDGEKAVTLFVSVNPDETWQRACPYAVECRKILVQHDLHDVHCEMKVGVIIRG